MRFVRSAFMWRSPVVHILFSVTEDEWADEPGVVYVSYTPVCATSGCTNAYNDADLYDAIPPGFTLCQRCVETLEFVAHRNRQRRTPDRAAYNARTVRLLNAAQQYFADAA